MQVSNLKAQGQQTITKKATKDQPAKLILLSLAVSILCSFLALSLKLFTEFFEDFIFDFIFNYKKNFFIILPSVGITMIFFLRKYLFKNRRNKGIIEIYKTINQNKSHLAFFKIPSHYINGFLTVIFGGSTGIEVSTVVATAALGNYTQKHSFLKKYQLELICAGVASGIGILFNSPLGGLFFAVEVIARQKSKMILLSTFIAVLTTFCMLNLYKTERIFPIITSGTWKWIAIPFFVVLSLLSGFLSVYFTKLVIHIKAYFSGINNNFLRVNSGAVLVGSLIFFFPFLYGDSYNGVINVLSHPQSFSIFLLLCLAILKPIASAVTLGAGGDGGVFAPSIVSGAALGVAFALLCNHQLNMSFDYINFALVGAAATLSASIYAPLTSLFLICNIVPDGFYLFVPILLSAWIAPIFAKRLLPYNVYTYQG